MTSISPTRGADAAASGPRPRALLWWALALLTVVVVRGAVLLPDPSHAFTQPMDDAMRTLFGVGRDSGAYTWALPMMFQYLGELPGVIVGVILIPAGLAIVGRWRSTLFLVAVIAGGAGAATQIAKNVVDRPRPSVDAAAGLYGPLFRVDHGSFPSGHCAMAAAVVVGVAALIPAAHRAMRATWWVVGALIMAGTCWQRMLINAHWFTDTVSGLFIGAGFALLMWWAFWPWLQRDHALPVRFGRRPAASGTSLDTPSRKETP